MSTDSWLPAPFQIDQSKHFALIIETIHPSPSISFIPVIYIVVSTGRLLWIDFIIHFSFGRFLNFLKNFWRPFLFCLVPSFSSDVNKFVAIPKDGDKKNFFFFNSSTKKWAAAADKSSVLDDYSREIRMFHQCALAWKRNSCTSSKWHLIKDGSIYSKSLGGKWQFDNKKNSSLSALIIHRSTWK